jgi:hypothetical protein
MQGELSILLKLMQQGAEALNALDQVLEFFLAVAQRRTRRMLDFLQTGVNGTLGHRLIKRIQMRAAASLTLAR